MSNNAINVQFSGYTNFTASAPAQRVMVLNTNNNQYLRYAILSQDNLQVVYYTSSCVIPLTSIYSAVFSGSPNLTYPPIINIQPTSSTVTHPNALYFAVSASAETPISYQWYWQSSSLNTYVPTPSATFSGTASAALTCSTTVVATENSASYYCIVSNTTGGTTSSIVQSYIL